ncbi:MAG: hypothetical protein K2J51_00720 [Alistipes sp.]|nr:hypothetical protein [Alistipes sp.]
MINILMLAFALLSVTAAAAQNVPLGKRIPEIKAQSWLGGRMPSADAGLRCIEFFHPKSARSLANVEHLRQLRAETGGAFDIIVVSGADERSTGESLARYADDGTAVAVDEPARLFGRFGVSYLPACMVVGSDGRVLWTGDSKQLTPAMIRKLKCQSSR